MQVELYGIGNCDKVRAALAWLAQRFHDFKRHGVTQALLADWLRPELGFVNASMRKLNEHIESEDLDPLKSIYRQVIKRLPLPA